MSRKTKALEFANEGYNIKITGRNVQITDSMKNYAMEQISKIERFSHRIIDVNVIMDIQKLDHRAEIIAKIDHIKITSQAISNDMYASIDKAVDKLKAQLLRYKTKIQDYHSRGIVAANRGANIPSQKEEEEFDLEESDFLIKPKEYQLPKITKQERLPIKTLTYNEALFKLDFSDNAFLIFRNEEDQKIKILYRLENEDYGVIEPEIHE